MRVSINVGTRFPAYATSMGRVLLAALEPDALDAYLARAEIRPLTARTIATPDDAARGAGTASAPRAGRSSTRSSRRACARSPPRSATAAAASSPPSTSPRTPAAPPSDAVASSVLLPPLLRDRERIEADLRDVSPSRLRAS